MTEFFQQLYREQEYRHPVVVQRVKQDFGEDEFKDLTTDKKLVLVNYLLNDQFRANEYQEYTKDQKRDHLTWILDKYDKSRIAKVPQNTFEESLQYFYDTINSTILRFNYITDQIDDTSTYKDYKEQREEFLNFQKNLLSKYSVTDYKDLSTSQRGNFDQKIQTVKKQILNAVWNKQKPSLISLKKALRTRNQESIKLSCSDEVNLLIDQQPTLYQRFKEAVGEEEFSIMSDKQKYIILASLSGPHLTGIFSDYIDKYKLKEEYGALKTVEEQVDFIKSLNSLYQNIEPQTDLSCMQMMLTRIYEDHKHIQEYIRENASQDFINALTNVLGNKKEYENFPTYKKYIALKFYQISDKEATSEDKEEELKKFLLHSYFKLFIPTNDDFWSKDNIDKQFYKDGKNLSALESNLSFYQQIDNYDNYSAEKKIKMLSIMSNYTQIINDLDPIEQKAVVNYIAIVATKPTEQQNEQEYEEIENNFKNYIIEQYIQHCNKPLNSSGQVNRDYQNYQILQNAHIYLEEPESQFFFLQTLSHMRKMNPIKDDNLQNITEQAVNFVDAFVESHKTYPFEYSLKKFHKKLVKEFGSDVFSDIIYQGKDRSNQQKIANFEQELQSPYEQELEQLRELEIKNNGNKDKVVDLIDGINDFSLNKQYCILKYFKQLSDYPGAQWTQYVIDIYDKLYPEQQDDTTQKNLSPYIIDSQFQCFNDTILLKECIATFEQNCSEFLNEIPDYDKMNDIQKYFIFCDINGETLQQMEENERQEFFQNKITLFNKYTQNLKLQPNDLYTLPSAIEIYETIMQAEYEANVYTTYKKWSSLDDSSKCVDESNKDIIKKLENYGRYIEYTLLTQKKIMENYQRKNKQNYKN